MRWNAATLALTAAVMLAPVLAGTATAEPITHATRGTVRAIDATAVVIARPGNRGDITFVLTPSTHREGTIAVGSAVSVRYREEGGRHVATAIALRRSKN